VAKSILHEVREDLPECRTISKSAIRARRYRGFDDDVLFACRTLCCIDKLAREYTGEGWEAKPGEQRLLARVRPEHVSAYGL